MNESCGTLRDIPDRELLRTVTENNRQIILTIVYERYHARLREYVNRLEDNRFDVEDVVQDTFISFYVQCDQWREILDLNKYLQTLAYRKMMYTYRLMERKIKHHLLFKVSQASNVETVPLFDARLLQRVIHARINLLHGGYLKVYRLSAEKLTDPREISAITGLSVNTVRKYLAAFSRIRREVYEEYRKN